MIHTLVFTVICTFLLPATFSVPIEDCGELRFICF